jgi:dephospho-CoA kinase
MLIGITGGIGTGKSAVAESLARRLHAVLLNADQICRDLLDLGQPGYRHFVTRFGDQYLSAPGGTIDRARLRRALFADETMRRGVEEILHPLVRQEVLSAGRSAGRHRCVVAEVPLLFECGWREDFDFVVCVDAPRSVVIERVSTRDTVSQEDVERIIALQLPVEHKRRQADWLIENDADQAALEKQVAQLADFLREQCGGGPKSHQAR